MVQYWHGDIKEIMTDLSRLRESINLGHIPEEAYTNYIKALEDPWKYMVVEDHKKTVLNRLKEFSS